MSVPPLRWHEFNQVANIDFRTACNEAVAPSERPLGRAVLARVAERGEPGEMFEQYLGSGQPTHPDAVLAWLAKEPRWRTIVTEVLHDWKNAESQKQAVLGRLVKWFNERVDGRPSLKERTAGLLITSMAVTGGATSTYAAAKLAVTWAGVPEALSLPVHVEVPTNASPLVVTIQPPKEPTAIPLNVSIKTETGSATIPIKVVAESDPIRFAPDQLAALDRISTAVTDASTALQEAGRAMPRHTEEIRNAISQIRAFDPEARQHLAPLARGLEQIEAALKNNQEQTAALESVAAKLGYTGRQIELLGAVAGTGRMVTTVTATENASTPPTALVWTDVTGAISHCDLNVTLGPVRNTVAFKEMTLGCGEGTARKTFAANLTRRSLRVGDMIRFADLPVAVTVESIVRPIIGANHAVLRVLTVTGEAARAAAGARPAGQ
jgi:hypothetical protein